MRLSRPLLAAPVVGLLVGVAVTGCSSSDDGSGPFRPPSAAALAAGPCALVADDVVALGRTAHDLRGVKAPSDAVRTALSEEQDRLSGFADAADPSVKPQLEQLVLRTGLVRVQADTRLVTADQVEGMTTAYLAAAKACTRPSAATPTAVTGSPR